MTDKTNHPALAWWQDLQPKTEPKTDEDAPKKHRGNPAALARLRRATTPQEALMVEAAHILAGMLKRDEQDWMALGTLAATLAHVRADEPDRKTAAIFGHQDATDTPRLVSELRFRRLLQAERGGEQMAALRRALAITGGRANIADLADSLLWWTERTRVRWLFEYYGDRSDRAADAEPTQPARQEAAR